MNVRLIASLLVSSTLAGCYIIPIDQHGRPAGYAVAPGPTVPPPIQQVTLSARLYPANDLAAATGVLAGSVVNHLNGSGNFTLNWQGETLTGEATRASQQGRQGVANAYGTRGTYVRCAYTMNSSVQGTGECSFSNGARYTLHLSG